jgi:hypothetical protein
MNNKSLMYSLFKEQQIVQPSTATQSPPFTASHATALTTTSVRANRREWFKTVF